MALLLIGVLLWCGTHLSIRLAPQFRLNLINKLGDGKYRAAFSITIVFSIILIVLGWRSASPEIIYAPSGAMRHISMLIISIGFILLGSGHGNNFISSRIRHPMLTGTLFWAVGHLIANGDSRSVTLFGIMAIWAVLEIYLINKAKGAWDKPEPQGAKTLIKPLIINIVIIAVIVRFLHVYLSGIPLV